jgi:tripartite-type tricarboxylate transporter receptor subunit TctC
LSINTRNGSIFENIMKIFTNRSVPLTGMGKEFFCKRRSLIGAMSAGAVTAFMPSALLAQSPYPSKAVTLIVPNPPGGNTDILARIFSVPLAKALGQPVVVENRAGAGGVIGMTAAARALPDGHTLGLGNLSDLVVSRYAQPNVPYDPAKDFSAVATLAKVSIVVTCLPSFPAKSFQEFLALAKTNPGKYKCGTAGNGTIGHLCLEALKAATGLDMVHVPYRGGAPALNDLLGGHIDVLIDGSALSQVKAGKLKALAVTAERIPVLPTVPAISESGVPGFSFGNYWGLLMPTGAPAVAVARIHSEISKLLEQPDIRQQLENAGFAALASTPTEYGQALQKSYDQIGQLVKKAKISFD